MAVYDSQGRLVVVSAGVQGLGVSTLGNTAGNTGTSGGVLVLAGSNNVSLSQSSNTAGNTVWINATGGGGGGVALSAGTQSQSTGTVVFANSNGVSFGMSGSSQITASHNAGVPLYSNGSLFRASTSGAAGTTTVTENSMWLAGALSITVLTIDVGGGGTSYLYRPYLFVSHVLSGSNGSYSVGSISFFNSNGISFYTTNSGIVASHNALTTAAQSNQVVNSLNGSTGQVSLATGSSLSSSQNGSTITFGLASNITTALQSAGAYLTTAAQSNHSHGNPTLALTNLSGTTASASNGLTLSLSAAAPGGGGGAGTNTGLNLTNLTGTLSVNTNGVSLSMSAAAPGGGAAPNRSYIEIMNGERLTRPFNVSATQFSNRPIFLPFWLDGAGLIPSTVRFFWSWVTNTRPPVFTMGAGIYSLANSTQLTLEQSTTATVSFATTQSASYSGIRAIDITGMTGSINEGRRILAIHFSAAGTTNLDASFYGGDNFPAVVGFISGASGTATTANSNHFFPFWGVYSANSGALPNSVGLTQINGGRSADVLDLYAVLKQI